MINMLLTQESIKILEKERDRIVNKIKELQDRISECEEKKQAIDEVLIDEIQQNAKDLNELKEIVKLSLDEALISREFNRIIKNSYEEE